MRTIGQHRDEVEALVTSALPVDGQVVALDDLVDGAPALRVLAGSVTTPVPLPPFDNSQMDGFAVRAADAGRLLRLVDAVPAGAVPAPLEPGTAAPIMTGAPIPAGADAVFPVESTSAGSFPAALDLDAVTVPEDLVSGTFVRTTGSDLPLGGELAAVGAALTPPLLGALAAAGVDRVPVRRRPRVLVVSTGSELAGAVSRSGAGSASPSARSAVIGDANGVSLRAALAEVGVETRAVRVPDDVTRFTAALDDAVSDWADLVLTTGGISAGAFEVVRQALEPRGLRVTSVAMQPGGPQASGTVSIAGRPVPVVAFPGNPVSALVSFEVFLRPVLARAAGLPGERPTAVLPAAEPTTSPEGKHQVRRGRVVDGRVHFVGGPSSHLLAHHAAATHLVHVPVGTAVVEPGDPLTVWSIR